MPDVDLSKGFQRHSSFLLEMMELFGNGYHGSLDKLINDSYKRHGLAEAVPTDLFELVQQLKGGIQSHTEDAPDCFQGDSELETAFASAQSKYLDYLVARNMSKLKTKMTFINGTWRKNGENSSSSNQSEQEATSNEIPQKEKKIPNTEPPLKMQRKIKTNSLGEARCEPRSTPIKREFLRRKLLNECSKIEPPAPRKSIRLFLKVDQQKAPPREITKNLADLKLEEVEKLKSELAKKTSRLDDLTAKAAYEMSRQRDNSRTISSIVSQLQGLTKATAASLERIARKKAEAQEISDLILKIKNESVFVENNLC